MGLVKNQMSQPSINIYIAASIQSVNLAKSIAAELVARGHKITSSWHVAELLAPSDIGLPQEARRQIANAAVGEIFYSDALLILAHKDGRGSLFEAGVAVGCDIPVVALGNRLDVTLMLETGYVTWVNFKEDAFAKLDEIAISEDDDPWGDPWDNEGEDNGDG